MKIPDFETEQALLKQGFSVIGGVDEVGRGCWAGPVVAACVVLDQQVIDAERVTEIRDSKVLSKTKREHLDTLIKDFSVWAIGECSAQEIDSIGIGKATQLAMLRAVQALSVKPNHLLLDGREAVALPITQRSIIDGDATVLSIAAASIVAKVYRDALMTNFDLEYPGYGFSQHVGYGTKQHQEALKERGTTPLHRTSYKPIQKYSV